MYSANTEWPGHGVLRFNQSQSLWRFILIFLVMTRPLSDIKIMMIVKNSTLTKRVLISPPKGGALLIDWEVFFLTS